MNSYNSQSNRSDIGLSLTKSNFNAVSSLAKLADETFTKADLKIHELNTRGRIEKIILRTRIEYDDKSPYKFLL